MSENEKNRSVSSVIIIKYAPRLLWQLTTTRGICEHVVTHVAAAVGGGGGGACISPSGPYLCSTLAPGTEHGPGAKLRPWEAVLGRGRRRECCEGWSHQTLLSSCRILGALCEREGGREGEREGEKSGGDKLTYIYIYYRQRVVFSSPAGAGWR